MTDRLYYRDPYLTEFEAVVVAAEADGDRSRVVLDRTAFYPTSGGQPFDAGTLGGARVVDVVEHAGDIVHIIDGAPPAGTVIGRIDRERRFDHMQQHTGQHVLSAAVDQVCGVRTESFHLGSLASTIDLARELTAAEMFAAEDLANEVVWADRPVNVRFVDAAAAAALPLRKESSREGTLRIIDIDGFDVSACGGTHVARTGAVGVVAISGWERFKGGTRLEFRCGGRALRAYRTLRDIAAVAGRHLSVGADDLPQAIERLQEENGALRRQAKELQGTLTRVEAESLAGRAEEIGGIRVVLAILDGRDAGTLKPLAQLLVSRPGYLAVLTTGEPPLNIVVARAPDVSVDPARLLETVIGTFGGRGGGRGQMAQGGGIAGTPAEVLDAVRAAIG